jgi:hypothetical protein
VDGFAAKGSSVLLAEKEPDANWDRFSVALRAHLDHHRIIGLLDCGRSRDEQSQWTARDVEAVEGD